MHAVELLFFQESPVLQVITTGNEVLGLFSNEMTVAYAEISLQSSTTYTDI
jgi:hypothetical protein